MSSESKRYWIFGVTSENWKVSLEHNLWGLRPRDLAFTKKILKGDVLLIFVSGVRPFGFHGSFEVVGDWTTSTEPLWTDEVVEGGVLYPHRVEIRPIDLGFAEYEKLVPKLSFVAKKERSRYWFYLRGTPANLRRPIEEEDYRTILEELKKNPPVVLQTSQPRATTEGKPTRRPTVQKPGEPMHFKIRDLLVEIGKLKGMEESVSEYSFDHFKLDVAWKESKVRAGPDYVFEVHIGGDLWKDLASLKHAYDRFHCSVFLVGRPEDRVLVQQILPGAYHEMSRKFKFIEFGEVSRLYEYLKQAKDLEGRLGL